jgi:hypothetical protein
MGRRFLLVAATGFFLVAAVLVVAFLVGADSVGAVFVVLAVEFLAGVLADALFFFSVGAFSARVFSAGALAVDVDDWDWAVAGVSKPSQRKRIPARTATAKRRTQTLPTAESWLP